MKLKKYAKPTFHALCLTLALMLTLPACGGQDIGGTGNFQKDLHQSAYSGAMHICGAGGGIYLQIDEILYYLDPDAGRATVLCGKPDCGHTGAGCNARIRAYGLWPAGDSLCLVTSSGDDKHVVSMGRDGTGRREVQELKFTAGGTYSSYASPICHRDTVYYFCDDTLWAVALGGRRDSARALWSSDSDISDVTLWADGDTVYFMASIPRPGGTCRDTLFACDTGSGQVSQVWTTPDEAEVGRWTETGVAPSQWYVEDGSIYFFLAGNGLFNEHYNDQITQYSMISPYIALAKH